MASAMSRRPDVTWSANDCRGAKMSTISSPSTFGHPSSALGPRNVRVNAVAPGVVATDMSSFTKTDAGREFTLGIQALKRLAQPDDVGGVIAFLASDDARWITGDTIRVDGGSKL